MANPEWFIRLGNSETVRSFDVCIIAAFFNTPIRGGLACVQVTSRKPLLVWYEKKFSEMSQRSNRTSIELCFNMEKKTGL